MEINDRLRLIRESMQLSQAKFAIIFNLPQSTYAQYEKGGRAIPDDLKKQLYDKGFSINWLITGNGSMRLDEPDKEVAPIYNYESEDVYMVPMTNLRVSAGYGEEWGSGEFDGNYVAVPWRIIRKYCSAKDCAAATVKGDSMQPTLKDGEVVIFCKGLIEDDGIYVISILGDLFVKRVSIDRLNKMIRIISDNGKYPVKEYDIDREGLEVLGKVIFWIHEE